VAAELWREVSNEELATAQVPKLDAYVLGQEAGWHFPLFEAT